MPELHLEELDHQDAAEGWRLQPAEISGVVTLIFLFVPPHLAGLSFGGAANETLI